jgi:O-antigen/teichoic acid export membrane protein
LERDGDGGQGGTPPSSPRADDPEARAGPSRRLRAYAFGGASQLACSLTNFGLTLLSARAIGAGGVGEIYVGFACYTLLLGIQRGLVSDPLTATTAALPASDRTWSTRGAVSTTLCSGGLMCAATAVVSLFLRGDLATGLLVFVPWLAMALLQDLWRAILFRDGRGTAAAANDLTWLVVMAALVPIAFAWRSPWSVVAVWGGGALAGAALGFVQTGLRPCSPAEALRWFRTSAWPLGKYLAAGNVAYAASYTALVVALAAIVGSDALGGYRVIQAAFAPLTLLGPALALPGLPALTRRVERSERDALKLTAEMGLLTLAGTAVYIAVASVAGVNALGAIFGHEFRRFQNLVLPVALGQLLVAPLVGFGMLLIAQRRGRASFFGRLVSNAATLALGLALAAAGGIRGGAWGMAIGSAAGALTVAVLAVWPPRGSGGAAGLGDRPPSPLIRAEQT